MDRLAWTVWHGPSGMDRCAEPASARIARSGSLAEGSGPTGGARADERRFGGRAAEATGGWRLGSSRCRSRRERVGLRSRRVGPRMGCGPLAARPVERRANRLAKEAARGGRRPGAGRATGERRRRHGVAEGSPAISPRKPTDPGPWSADDGLARPILRGRPARQRPAAPWKPGRGAPTSARYAQPIPVDEPPPTLCRAMVARHRR